MIKKNILTHCFLQNFQNNIYIFLTLKSKHILGVRTPTVLFGSSHMWATEDNLRYLCSKTSLNLKQKELEGGLPKHFITFLSPFVSILKRLQSVGCQILLERPYYQ